MPSPHLLSPETESFPRVSKRAGKGCWLDGTGPLAILASVAESDERRIQYDRREERGPFDLIGDVHGCYREMQELLSKLGYELEDGCYTHPEGRKAVFLGDIVDRGPRIPDVIRTVSKMYEAGAALFVPGNHDERFAAYLIGTPVELSHGLEQTVEQIEGEPPGSQDETVNRFLRLYMNAPPYLWLDDGKLVAVHAGLEEPMIGEFDNDIWVFCLMGKLEEAHGDEFPIRRIDWSRDYRGDTLIAYGHTPCRNAQLSNNTINVDQGCVFGGMLSALRYPENEVVSVAAARPYFLPGLVP